MITFVIRSDSEHTLLWTVSSERRGATLQLGRPRGRVSWPAAGLLLAWPCLPSVIVALSVVQPSPALTLALTKLFMALNGNIQPLPLSLCSNALPSPCIVNLAPSLSLNCLETTRINHSKEIQYSMRQYKIFAIVNIIFYIYLSCGLIWFDIYIFG